MSDVLITPASKKIEFKDASSNIDGLIKLDTNDNLVISSVNDLVLGDGATDLHIGDGTNSIDLVFDQAGRIYSAGNKHLTIGKSSLNGNDVVVDSPNWSVTDAGVATFAAIQSYPGNIAVNDGVKMTFGTDADMFIVHDGSNATIQNDTGLLNIDGQTGIYFDVNGSNNFRIMSDHVGSWRDFRLWSQTRVRFYDSDTSNYVALRAPDTVSSDLTWKLPAADGSSGQQLKTDGSGNLGWATATGSSDFYLTAEWNDPYFTDALRTGKKFAFGGNINNNTNTDGGTATEVILPKACVLREMHFWIGNVGAETGSGNFTVRVDKNGTELTTAYTFNMSGSGGNHVQKSFTPDVSFADGDTFNLTVHDAAGPTYANANQIGRVRVTFRFELS